MSLVPRRIIEDKHCFVPCPPDRCNCRAGNPMAWDLQQLQLGVLPEVDSLELEIQIKLIAEMAKHATGGNWSVEILDEQLGFWKLLAGGSFIARTTSNNGEANAQYLAALSPMTVMKLIGTIRRLQQEIDRRHGIGGELMNARRERDEALARVAELERKIAEVTKGSAPQP